MSSNTSLEITTIEIQDSYNTIQRFPGKILPLNYSKLAFEVPGKIADVKIDIGDAVNKYGRLYTLYSIANTAEDSALKIRLKAKKWFD